MTNALTIKPLTPSTWQMIQSIAPIMHTCRLFGINSEHQAAAIMLKGYELGLSLTASFEFIHVVQGKPTLSPRGTLALILQSPDFGEMKIEDSPDGCSVWMKRKNGFEYTSEFTLEDAKKAGVVKPGSGWESYPKNMLRWRAVGFCADVVFPDVIGGMKRADEMGASITPEGDVIEGNWQVYTEQPKVDPLSTLLATYTPEQILAVCEDGVLPQSEEEIALVIEKLEGQNA